MVFLNPLFLWTLLGLSIPIAIHFWSKKKVKTIKIGSTQLLKEQNPKQTSSIRLNQWVLLVLRMLILGLLAMILAVPSIEFLRKEKSITYLVEPSLLGVEKINTILDTIDASQIRLLQTDFPLLKETEERPSLNASPNYWQLAQQMELLQTDSIVVFTKGLLRGFKGMRPEIKVPVHWVVIEAGEQFSIPVELMKQNDQFSLITLQSDYSELVYNKETYTLDRDIFYVDNKKDSVYINPNKKTLKLAVPQEKKQEILIVWDDNFSAEKMYISSAFEALSAYLDQEITLKTVKEIQGVDLTSYDVLVWLKNEAAVPFSGNILLWQPDVLALNLIEAGWSNNEYLLKDYLNAENSVDLNLPAQLLVLLERHKSLPKLTETYDQRTMDIQEIRPNENYTEGLNNPKELKEISTWLWTLLLLVLPIERILSKYKKQ